MTVRSSIIKRITNEGSFGIRMIFRAIILLFGFWLTNGFDKARLFRFYFMRRIYYGTYALGKLLVDSDKIKLLHRKLKPGDIFLDVGGAFGFFTALAVKIVGPKGKVIVFEPDPICIRFIEDLIEFRKLSNIQLVKAAAWCEDTELKLHLCPENRGENSIFKSPIHSSMITIPAYAIDNYLWNEKQVDFVKIDVQGAEDAVIRGMRQTIISNTNIEIICECSPSDILLSGISIDKFLKNISETGLKAYRLDRVPMTLIQNVADLEDLINSQLLQCDLLLVSTPQCS